MTVQGDSADSTAAVTGTNSDSGAGVFGASTDGEGVRGETGSNVAAAVAGVNFSNIGGAGTFGRTTNGPGPGVLGTSVSGQGVRGESTDNEGVRGVTGSEIFAGVAGVNNSTTGTGAGVFGQSTAGEGVHGETGSNLAAAVAGVNNSTTGTGAGVFGQSISPVGVGVLGKGGRFAGLFEGDVAVTGDIQLLNADCAEEFGVSETDDAEPGTVMVIDEDESLRPSRQPYDKKVAGVVSGAKGYKPAITLDKRRSEQRRLPIALVGKVYCKVDAHYSPIEIGDLLTTSLTPGHAMKADDRLKAPGAVLGKALRSFHSGRGMIPVLVALQ